MPFDYCKNCKKHKEIHAKEFCITCYKKLIWKPKSKICKRCSRLIPLHAKGLCDSCYNFVFKLSNIKYFNYNKHQGISLEKYKKITEKCIICGFNKIVELHHLDENKENNLESNLVGLCPNHLKMFHDFRYRKEIVDILKNKGFVIPKDPRIDFELD